MMEVQYRKIYKRDLPTFINMRINQLQEEGAEPVIDLKPYLKGIAK
jgi:tRNA (Thr-GGU) A37 N-methylase